MRAPLTTIVLGLLVGAGLAFTGIVVAPDGATATETTTTTEAVANRSTPPWYHPRETVVGSAAVVLDGLTVEDGEAVLRYRTFTLAPKPAGIVVLDENGNDAGPGVVPEDWVIVTAAGDYPGTSRNTNVHEAHFTVDDQFSLGKVTGIRITRYRMRVPYGYDVEMSPTVGATITLDDALFMSVETVIAQSTSVIFHLAISRQPELFTSSDSNRLGIRGVGPEWTVSNSLVSGSGLSLTRQGPDIPDPLVLRVSSSYWLAFDRTVDLDIGGLHLE